MSGGCIPPPDEAMHYIDPTNGKRLGTSVDPPLFGHIDSNDAKTLQTLLSCREAFTLFQWNDCSQKDALNITLLSSGT